MKNYPTSGNLTAASSPARLPTAARSARTATRRFGNTSTDVRSSIRRRASRNPSSFILKASDGWRRATRGSRHNVDRHRAPELLFVESGAIRDVNSGEVLDTHSAFRVDPADTGRELEVMDDCVLFFVQLPKFDTKSAAAAA